MFTQDELQVLKHLVNKATFTGIKEAEFVLVLNAKLDGLIEEANGDVSTGSESSPDST